MEFLGQKAGFTGRVLLARRILRSAGSHKGPRGSFWLSCSFVLSAARGRVPPARSTQSREPFMT